MNNNKKTIFYKSTYPEDRNKAMEFLRDFTDQSLVADETHQKRKYMIDLHSIAKGESKRLEILVEDLENFFNDDPEFVRKIVTNTLSYQRVFIELADQLIADMRVERVLDEEGQLEELLMMQRMMNIEGQEQNGVANPQERLPGQLRKYELYFLRGGQTKEEILSVRQLGSSLIGQLVTVRAMVVRTSDVRPLITVASFSCDSCGHEMYQTVPAKQFNPITECKSNKCEQNKIRGKLVINHATSKFIPYQELKIQELTEQLPQGAIPRAFTVECRGETNIRMATPGDRVTLQGVFLPNEKLGFFQYRNLTFNTYIEAYKITRDKKKYTEIDLNNQTALQVLEEFNKLEFSEFYSRISRSIAPEIFGMEDVKKALLLMMITGVTKEMHDGMRIRGDINVALIGDPGVAKSQLLKFICSASPRAIYTTGKGSSSVGLTAAVIRDEITNEMTLEGGALVMADMGICCIDEFDKMNESDRTAIHEVMEQQTVSIAKAGITTTLNARTSILAAANPLYGRYNKKLTPHQNINLPAALLSRFDLIFILLDICDTNQDELLARHIGFVHRNLVAPKSNFQPYTIDFIKTFIAMAKQYEPIVTQTVHDYIADKYVSKRMEQSNKLMEGYTYTTPRTLLAVIRLSQALAKCRFAREVNQDDVEEAIRLMEQSQDTVREAMSDDADKKPRYDKITAIYSIIKEACNKHTSKSTQRSALEKKILAKGFTMLDLEECYAQYQSINVILLSKTMVNLIG